MKLEDSEPYNTLNKSWKSTCKVIFGEEVGDLKEYDKWLSEHIVPLKQKKSSISGKDVYCALTDYADDSKFISLEEVKFDKKFEPLNINEIKDIDSIVESLKERFQYCGNIVLANSKHVEKSSDVQDSFYILGSNFVYNSEYVAYSSYIRGSKHLFGVISDYQCSNLIRVFETHKQSRCLEAWKCYNSSDVHFSSCVKGTQDALFSFNIENKRNVIGNIEFPREKYLELKKKLMEELRQELMKNKKLPSLMDIVSSSTKLMDLPKTIKFSSNSEEKENKEPIEKGFQKTTNLLFGKTLQDFDSYNKWLGRYIPSVDGYKSVASSKKVYVSNINPCNLFLRDRLVDSDECWEIGKHTKLEPSEIQSLDKIKKSIGKIAFLNPGDRLGECRNLMKSPLVNTSINAYNCPIASFNECAAYSYWSRTSKYMFGSALAFTSNFCINAYYSMNLSRAFEVDGSNNCSDVYFIHNCENVKDSMFCFNAKNLRFAIGNSPLSLDQYKKIKSSILEQMTDELEKNKDIPWSIFNIGGNPNSIEGENKKRSKLWYSKHTG